MPKVSFGQDASIIIKSPMTASPWFGVEAESREVLLAYIKDFLSENPHKENAALLTIKGPCGWAVSYRTAEEIPHESVPCRCGNPQHWIIVYRGKER